jgi:hypothetical protein
MLWLGGGYFRHEIGLSDSAASLGNWVGSLALGIGYRMGALGQRLAELGSDLHNVHNSQTRTANG